MRLPLFLAILVAPVLAVTMPPPPPMIPTPPRPVVEPEKVTTCHLQGSTCWSDR